MDQIILMAVFHPFYYLSEKDLSSFLIQSTLFLDQFEQLTTLKELHDDGNFHVF